MQVYELLSKMIRRHSSTDLTKAYVVNAAFKLTTRFSEPEVLKKLQKVLTHFSSSVHLELQARSCEYLNLMKDEFRGAVQAATLKPMPLPDLDAMRRRRQRVVRRGARDSDDSDSDSDDSGSDDEAASPASGRVRKPLGGAGGGEGGGAGGSDVGGILGIDFGSTDPTPAQSNGGSGNSSGGGGGGGGDLLDLADIFGSGGSGSGGSSSNSAPAAPAASGGDDLLGMFGMGGGNSGDAGNGSVATPQPDYAPINAYEKNGVKMVFGCFKTGQTGVTRVVATTTKHFCRSPNLPSKRPC